MMVRVMVRMGMVRLYSMIIILFVILLIIILILKVCLGLFHLLARNTTIMTDRRSRA